MMPVLEAKEESMNDAELKAAITAAEKFRQAASRELYSKIRTEREKATFAMMMRMNPEALTNIRKEFFVRRDEIDLNEFIYIIQKHLNKSSGFEGKEQREFGMKMFDLFKDIDVNGDGNLEWQEFTTYVVEKANLLNKRLKSTSIPHYYDSSESLDASSQYRHRHDISKFVKIPNMNQFAMVEDHKNSIFLFNSRLGKHISTIPTESAPVSLEYVLDKDLLVASCADMTLSTYSMADPNPNRRYKQKSAWSTPGVQMALAYMPANQLLYSGGTNGNLYSWKISDRSLVSTFSGHTDIVMALTILKKLNNVASGSLDKTVNVWDSYTNSRVLELHGHKKGVLDMTYSHDYRLIFSCGFEHDACVWSPFVNSLVYRFKGHHASLVGIQAIEDTPEVITADIQGVFKLWDIRNYQCVQTFTANLTGSDTKDSSKLSCFFQTRLPPANSQQKEDDSRIFAASKMIFSFDQARVVHDATTDFTSVQWVGWNAETSNFITVSDKTVIVWDALIGSKTVTNSNISAEEISACCLDDRKRKIILGDVHGKIGVYNCTNGALMKTVQDDVNSTVVALEYVDSSRRFIAGYVCGIMRIYDENSLEDCNVVRTFDSFNHHPELMCLAFNPHDNTIASAGASSGVARLWDYVAGKCEVELKVCDSTECVVYLKYLTPYPLIATADSKGNVCIWGSRGCKWAGKRLAGFMNHTPAHAKYERAQHLTPDGDEAPRRIVPSGELEEDGSESQFGQSTGEEDFASSSRRDASDDMSVESSLHSQSLDPNDQSTVLSPGGNEDMHAAHAYFAETESMWGRAMAAQCMTFEPSTQRLFTADDLGYLRCFSLKYLIHDISGPAMISGGSVYLKEVCQSQQRSDRSAPPPVYRKRRQFLVGRKNDVMSYMGIDFCWTIQAHSDRVIYTMCTSDGVITSAADRLVKMWTFDGIPIGVLLQSVPVGTKSRTWNLELDAEARMAQEDIVLDETIAGVMELMERDDIPDIDVMDLTGIEPGSEAADFSRSELRQRIELTTNILGIDFPTESELARRRVVGEEDFDSEVESTSTGKKSLQIALKELKSPSAAVDYDARAKTLTVLQKRRKATKMEIVSSLYEKKAGMKVNSSIPEEKSAEGHELDQFTGSVTSSSKGGKSSDHDSVSHVSLKAPKLTATVPSKILTSAGNRVTVKLTASGPRAQSMRNLCTKYSSFDALDRAMAGNKTPLSLSSDASGFKSSSVAASTSDKSPASDSLHRRETMRIHEFHQMLIKRVTNAGPLGHSHLGLGGAGMGGGSGIGGAGGGGGGSGSGGGLGSAGGATGDDKALLPSSATVQPGLSTISEGGNSNDDVGGANDEGGNNDDFDPLALTGNDPDAISVSSN